MLNKFSSFVISCLFPLSIWATESKQSLYDITALQTIIMHNPVMLSQNIISTSSSDNDFNDEKEVTPFHDYIAKLSFHMNLCTNSCFPPYVHYRYGDITLFDDDGFLTLAIIARLWQEYALQEQILTAPDSPQSFMNEFSKRPIPRMDIFGKIFQICTNRLLDKYQKNKKTFDLLHIGNLNKLSLLAQQRSMTFGEFFEDFGLWIEDHHHLFCYQGNQHPGHQEGWYLHDLNLEV